MRNSRKGTRSPWGVQDQQLNLFQDDRCVDYNLNENKEGQRFDDQERDAERQNDPAIDQRLAVALFYKKKKFEVFQSSME